MFRPLIATAAAALTAIGLVGLPAAAAPPPAAPASDVTAAAQTLNWTADNSTTKYKSAPTTAVAGAATIVFENSTATGNTTNMTHTLTFDTSTPGYNHDVTVNITANPTDSNGGKHQVDVTLTPGKYRYFCALPGHGQMVGEFTVTDGGGEDTTPPTVAAEVTGDKDPNGAYIGKATVALTATDDSSGVKSTEYNVDGGEWTAYSEPVVVDAVGSHMVHYRATDNAGNVSEEGMAEFTVVAGDPGDDTTPPTVAAEVTGEKDPNGAYIGKATVTVTATDNDGGSGVKTTEYNVDGGAWTAYTAPVVVDAAGQHMVHYRATDNAGNVSEEGMAEFTVVAGDPGDTTPPTVSAEVTGEKDPNGAYIDKATVTVTATDNEGGSGVATVEYEVDDTGFKPYSAPVEVTEPGDHAVQYRATDAAGNVSETGSVPFRVVEGQPDDTTPPETSAQIAGTQDAAGNYLNRATVTLSAKDDGSGVARIDYALDGGEYVKYNAPLVVASRGEHMVTYRAMDKAGNVSKETMTHFSVVLSSDPDTVPPSVSLVLSGNQDSNWNYVGSATATITAADPHSGVGKIEYALDDGAWTAYGDPVTIDETGAHTIRYRASDKAGNTSDEHSGTFNVVEAGKDACPNSNTRKTVTIADKNTGVSNVDTGNGCTVNDLIDENAAFPSHTAFVKHIGTLTKNLVLGGTLTPEQRNKIVSSLPR
jgi:uncharacterized cupredoxin-like copper-binding protein